MYVRHFGLALRPFGLPPDPNFVHDSGDFGRSFRAIRDSIESGERLHLLLGGAGTGKTTLLMKLVGELDYPGARVLVPYGHFSFEQIVHYVLARLEPSSVDHGDDDEGQSLDRVLHRLESRLEPVVILLDEGQNLTRETLRDVLRFVARERSDLGPGQVVLAGTEELGSLLEGCADGDLAAERIETHRLGPLGEHEVIEYINHRLSTAAERERTLFDQQALTCVARLSRGVPRIINLICDKALLMAFGDNKNMVTEESVVRATRDLELQPDLEELALIGAQIRAELEPPVICESTKELQAGDDSMYVRSDEDVESASPPPPSDVKSSRWTRAVDIAEPGLREAVAEFKRLVQRCSVKLRARVARSWNHDPEGLTPELSAATIPPTASVVSGEKEPAQSSRLPEMVSSWRSGAWRPSRQHVVAAWALVSTVGLAWVLTMASPENEAALRATQAELADARATVIEFESRVGQLVVELDEARIEHEILHTISAGLQEDLRATGEIPSATLARQEPAAAETDAVAAVSDDATPHLPVTVSADERSDRTYLVEKGDTLWSIARSQGVSVEQLNDWNRLAPENSIRVGQELRVGPNVEPHDGVTPTRPFQHEDARFYTVKSGDSLYGIARQFNVSVAELQEWNRLNKGELILAEQQLIVLQ